MRDAADLPDISSQSIPELRDSLTASFFQQDIIQ